MIKIRKFFSWLFTFRAWEVRTAPVPPELSVPPLTEERIAQIIEAALNKKLNSLFNSIRSEFHSHSTQNAEHFIKMTHFLTDHLISPSQPISKQTYVTGFQPSCLAKGKTKTKKEK